MPRTHQIQSAHDDLVRRQAKTYANKGYIVIMADHIDHPNGSPMDIGGFTPDITAVDPDMRMVICEVETEDTVNSEHTRSQLTAFRKAADESLGLLHLVVPTAYLNSSWQVVNGWGIALDEAWHG